MIHELPEGYEQNLFALSHLILTFDAGNEATMLHLRANPGNWQSFERVAAFYFFVIFAKEIQRHYDAGPVCPRSSRKR